jgi:starch phosphorylase
MGEIMKNKTPINASMNSSRSKEIDGFDSLRQLALDLHWSWNHCTDQIWRQLDPVLWELTHNPWIVLQTVAREKLVGLLGDPTFRGQVDALLQSRKAQAETPAWFQQNHALSPLTCVAYFSMEYMLSEALPIYSGGLGNVAGDQLKAASDLGVPVVGVGLLYSQGYFRQLIDKDGAQEALYPYNDPGQLPITPLRAENGEWLRLEIALPGYSVWLRAWQVQVGRVKLYLLDSNDAANFPAHRGITNQLYGGSPEMRLKQEILLGIGGWRLLEALKIKPEVCHLNEGHAAFVILERARSYMKESGLAFNVALDVTRAGNLFTSHTAVAAGFDRFLPELMEEYLGAYAKEKLGISFHDLMALGRQNSEDAYEPFNMAYLAIRGSGAVNGVSRLHGDVSRHLFSSLFPGWPVDEVPIGYVTNGVHMPSWDSTASDTLWTKACGKDRWMGTTETLEQNIRRVSDEELWEMRSENRHCLVEYVRERLPRELAASGVDTQMIDHAKNIFDPNALTLGFARRFATYKRPNLLLHDTARLLRILSDQKRPVQLIMAGKAHPADKAGQVLIQEWIQFIRNTKARDHVIFLSDYDMHMAAHLVRGVDVWINTPRRPWEACGTSGMKVLVNGGINLSELDGWWAEAYTPKVGWAMGDGQEHGEDPAWDAIEAGVLYEILEREVIPKFYGRTTKGLPIAWIAQMRESMSTLTPQFSTNRTVREYIDKYYLPSAIAYRKRSADKGKVGQNIINSEHTLKEKWGKLHFGNVKSQTKADQNIFEVDVYLDDIDVNLVRVELYANGINGSDSIHQEMNRVGPLAGASGGYVYSTAVSAARSKTDYTARIIPFCDGVAVPLEIGGILWQK